MSDRQWNQIAGFGLAVQVVVLALLFWRGPGQRDQWLLLAMMVMYGNAGILGCLIGRYVTREK